MQLFRTESRTWENRRELWGRPTYDLVKESIRRCMDVASFRAGLEWCPDREILFFPSGANPQRNISYRKVDGTKSRVAVTGKKQFGYGERAEPYHYQLAPIFRVGRDSEGLWWITTRIYVRVTDVNGTPFQGKKITSRRKDVAKSWWNQHWLARTLGVMQSLASDDGLITIGARGGRVQISTKPMTWECPVSIDAAAVERIGDFQAEMAALRFRDGEEGEDADG